MRPAKDGKWEQDLPPPITSADLTGIRRLVVEACHANAQIWEPQIGNTSLAFKRVGLPETWQELGKLLRKRSEWTRWFSLPWR